MRMIRKCRPLILLFFVLSLFLGGCKKQISESDIAGKMYVYEKEGFGSDFIIEIQKDGTFSYYEGALSSYQGFGKWEFDGNILCLTDNVEFAGNPIVNYFKVKGENLIFISENSSNFTYINVSDGDKFIGKELKS